MRLIILPILLSIILSANSAAWDMRGNIYPVENGIVEWTAENFAGFNNLGSESLRLNISDEQIDVKKAVYRSGIQERVFAHRDWGYYSTLSFLGKEYFIGYPDACRIAEPLSLLSFGSGSLGKVLIDSDESYTISSNEALPLQDGFSLKLSDAEDGVKISLHKADNIVDSQVLLTPSDYIFKASIGDEAAALIIVGIKGNVRLEPESFYTIRGLFQLSEETDPIDMGKDFGEMQVAAISDTDIELDNPRAISLSNGQDFELMDCIRIRTSDINASSNQLCIYMNSTDSDVAEIRGELASGSFSWTPQNFAGFNYDMNCSLGAEEITATITDGYKLFEPDGVTYRTVAQQKGFEFEDWGRYNAISFLGERCLASYMEDGPLSIDSESSLLSDEVLGRVLIDSNENRLIADGDNLSLEDGIQAKIRVDKSCNVAFIELYKDGVLIDRDYFQVPNTYTYKRTFARIGGEITVLAIHIAQADCTQNKSILVDGIFQISEDLVDISENAEYDKMTVQTVTSDYLIMNNEDNDIRLGKNTDTVLAGNYRIKTIDRGELWYYIYEPLSE